MCGIAGQIRRDEGFIAPRAEIYSEMQAALKRRGPDQDGIYTDASAALIHTRLAVIDIENGRQPMHFNARGERFTLVYNGELYNTAELRRELRLLGHEFETRSDTEVLGRAYIEWGRECVGRLNGIFAFAVWEANARRLFLARDRVGVKPLFYTLREDSIIFASEIPALLAHPDVPAELDADGIAELIFLGPGRTPGSGVLRGIRELEPGSSAEFTRRDFITRKYWSLVDGECTDSFAEAVEKTRYLVRDAIRRQLVSDVPICTFLSGGLDSGIISSVARDALAERGERLKTFTVGYRDNKKFFKAGKFQPNSDEDYIAPMNEYLGAEGHTVTLDTEQLVPALYEAAEARGLPGMGDVDSSLLLFCREVKKHVTVALSGECADEIFGGYPWYRDREIRDRDGFPWAQSTAKRQAMLRGEHKIDGAEFVDARYRDTVKQASVAPANSEERRVKEMVNLNFKWFMQTLLDRKDRMSMYSGLEVRVPFCDHRIAEYLYTLPWAYKDHGGYEKGLLREAARGLLPEEVLWRKTSPYPKTHNPAYLAAVASRLRAVLEDEASPVLEIVKKEALEALITDDGSQPWYGQLMTAPQTIAYFLQMNYWLKRFNVRII
ncbi:MAG: asparagine synthase (glutamine-hydrolyzing) [Oscillospiraceae bacterium]|jgi:asparagine synthase (glutamine-hydrolysing)|nr:asparagine synthase (glutamine-hydrolyzing) [Oscillospiraceae bacterium]